jgi:hypothetical protein
MVVATLAVGRRLKLFIFDSGYASDALLMWCQQVFGVETYVSMSRFVENNAALLCNQNPGLLNAPLAG